MHSIWKNLQRVHVTRWLIGIFIAFLVTIIAAALLLRGIPVQVVDGQQTYSFAISPFTGRSLDSILRQAQNLGMPSPGPLDQALADWNTTTVTLRRGVDLYVNRDGDTAQLVAYKGDTVGDALAGNGILLTAEDQVSPSRETVIGAALTVEIRRPCEVTVIAGGKKPQVLEVSGGTVEEALDQAGVKLREGEHCNYNLDKYVFDGMEIQVCKEASITVTVGGKTEEHQVSAATVELALEQCGISLGEEDRLNVRRDAQPGDGMKIVVKRVRTKEETDTEILPFETKYTYSQDLPAGEKNTLTAGLDGIKELKYRAVYVDEKLESRKLLSENITAEPIDAIIMQGTGKHTVAPTLPFDADAEIIGDTGDASIVSHRFGGTQNGGGSTGGNSGSGGNSYTSYTPPAASEVQAVGTFTDAWGKEVSYAKRMTGTCTAYCIPGGTTSVGLTAERGVIAVDPDIIPYGTRMYVASPDGSIVYGYGVAGDTGGACLAGDIVADLCYDTLDECSIIGRREMVLYLLP